MWGQLGDGTRDDHAVPSLVLGPSGGVAVAQLGNTNHTSDQLSPTMVARLPAPAVDVAAAVTSTCVALADDRVFCWGGNTSMQLGDGTIYARGRPTAVAF